MSVNHLFTTKSAQFLRPNPNKRLRDTAVVEIVKRLSHARSGQYEERRIREPHQVDGDTIHVTYACFPTSSEPSFVHGSPLREVRYAYFLLIEAPEALAVFQRNVEGVLEALSPYTQPWAYEALGGAFADDDPAYERISLRSMSVAGNVVRRRHLEADNLADSMAVSGVHRSIPSTFRTRGSSGVHTVAPGTNRIARKDVRAGLDELIRWSRETGAALHRGAANYPTTFLAQFCRAVPLNDLPPNVFPNAILFDLSHLRERWEESPADFEFLIARSPRSDEGHVLSEQAVMGLFRILENVFTIVGDDIVYASPKGKSHVVGRIRVNKHSISVRSGLLDRVHIRGPVAKTTSLSTYANQENNFVVTFTEPQFGYAERQLFEDGALVPSIDSLLQVFEARSELTRVTAEKAVLRKSFGQNGIFRFVEDSVVPPGAVLVCDDLGDEWADYIAVDSTSGRSRLLFVHCKHGSASSSASALQEPIGQAIKNLSRMHRGFDAFGAKIDTKWTTNYSDRNIPRIRRGASVASVKDAFALAVSNPNTERVVVLVLSGISLLHLNDELDALIIGAAKPHVSQLLWLLATFWSSCREHGVRTQILCQP